MPHIKTVITIIILCIITIITQAKDDNHGYFDIATTESHDSHDHDSHDHDHTVPEQNVGRAVGITTFAGFASSLGVFIIFCVKKEHIAFMPASLAFSAGVTIHLTFMTLIPECVDLFYHSINEESETLAEFYALLCVIGGILIMLVMDTLFHKLGVDPHNHTSDPSNVTHTTTTNTESAPEVVQVDSDNEEEEEEEQQEAGQTYGAIAVESAQQVLHDKPKESYSTYSRVSYKVAFAVILHHFPEAIATFVSLVHDFHFGIGVAFALSLHDIPAAVCISVPCYLATGSMVKPFILCGIAGITYPIGAFVGWIIIEATDESFTDGFIAVLFGITGGIMLYISFAELLPTAIRTANKFSNAYENKSKGYSVNTIAIILLFIGFFVMGITNILLKALGGHSH